LSGCAETLGECLAGSAAGDANGARDDVVGERRSGEVAPALRGRINDIAVATGLRNSTALPLVRSKEKELVAEDRAAERAAKQVFVELRRSARALLEIVRGVQERIAIKLKYIAVIVIRAVLDGCAYDRA
jgi:hypothetical protein